MITIDDMTREDISGVCLVEEECFTEPWSYSAFESEMYQNGAQTLIAIEDMEIIGFINARFVEGDGAVNNVAVTRKARGKGTASALLRVIIERAHKNGVISLNLEVRKSNTAAICLYEKHGFIEVGERKGFYRKPDEDALLMQLIL